MDYAKVPQEINNIVGDNVNLLAQLFPSAVKDGQVDLEALKEELGQFEEVDKEKYELTWAGKQDAKKKAQEDVYNRTLNYIEADSKNPEATENLYIEGDNLEVLKLLRQNYYGAIKMIYIDPPYNTGNDFVYNDNFAMSSKESDIAEGTRDYEGNPLQRNQQSSNRYHANWLSMIYPRLKVAKDLLMDDCGVIFISIDDKELENLKKVCNEVFGEENYAATFIWTKTSTPPALAYKCRKNVEYVLAYEKNWSPTKYFGSLLDNGDAPLLNTGNPIKKLRFPKGSVHFNYIKNGIIEAGDKEKAKLECDIIVVDGINDNDFELSGQFKWGQDTLKSEIESGTYFLVKTDKFSIRFQRVGNDDSFKTPTNFMPIELNTSCGVNTNESAVKELEELQLSSNFDYPKPTTLISALVSMVCKLDTNALVLDFFSGSATTAHAVMQLNAEDGGNRKFMMVQLPEETEEGSEAFKSGYPNICEIGKERIRRAGKKIIADNKDNEDIENLDIGFKVFRTSDTNIKWNLYDALGQLDTSAMTHTPDLADFTMGFKDIDVVYEVMLRQKDVPLSSTLETLSDIGSRTYLYGSAYLVCLETEIAEELIDKLAALDPLPIKFVFRDSAFKDDINLKDETFRRLKNLIERNSGLEKKSYTVEFI